MKSYNPEEYEETPTNNFKPKPLTDEDLNFIEYVIVPMLLRADLEYNKANALAERLKKKYSSEQVRDVMSTPFNLFAALRKEGIEVGDEFKFNIVEDKYWKDSADNDRRNSYVYYKAVDETKSNLVHRTPGSLKGTPKYQSGKARRTRQTRMARQDVQGNFPGFDRPNVSSWGGSRKVSVKSEFQQERSLNPGESRDQNFAIDLEEVRKSMQLLTQAEMNMKLKPAPSRSSRNTRRKSPSDDDYLEVSRAKRPLDLSL